MSPACQCKTRIMKLSWATLACLWKPVLRPSYAYSWVYCSLSVPPLTGMHPTPSTTTKKPGVTTTAPAATTTNKPAVTTTAPAFTTTTHKPSGTTTAPSTKTTIPVPGREFCKDKPDGIYANPDDKTTFYVCAGGRTYLKVCGAGTVFNDSCKCCAWP